MRLVTTLLALAFSVVTLIAQQPGVHPVSGRVYARTMSVDGAPWLERREREDEENPDLALRLLRIKKGATVADIGAGSGFITLRMAKIVGPMGKVYASDIQAGMLTLLQQNMARTKMDNVVPVLGTFDDPKWVIRQIPEQLREAIMFENGIKLFNLPRTLPALEGQARVW